MVTKMMKKRDISCEVWYYLSVCPEMVFLTLVNKSVLRRPPKGRVAGSDCTGGRNVILNTNLYGMFFTNLSDR